MKYIWYILFSMIGLAISVFLILMLSEYKQSNFENECKTTRSRFVDYEFYGLIERKWFDESNHRVPKLTIDNRDYIFEWHYRDIFRQVEVGDSITKAKGDEFVTRYRIGAAVVIDCSIHCSSFSRPFDWNNVFDTFLNLFNLKANLLLQE